MKNKSLGFIGGGRVTRIFLQALANKQFEPVSVKVYDTNREIADSLKTKFPGIVIADSMEQAAGQDIVFIALHPPAIMETLDKIEPVLKENSVIISLAPKITIEKIAGKLGIPNIARMIPNATSYINEGYNPVCYAGSFDSNKVQLLEFLNILGKTFEVPEENLEAYAIISAMLPTYFWFQWKTLNELGNKMGMQKEEARNAIYETAIASLNALFKSGEDFSTVMDLIPVKPIGEYEEQINRIYNEKLWALFEKIKP
jgi:pyrroline-5-carboxylate reductase